MEQSMQSLESGQKPFSARMTLHQIWADLAKRYDEEANSEADYRSADEPSDDN
jgi:hypothetical protein